ncbi:hypothetical protein [Melittangium boletus]|uniref:Uncharacterized protein n=1 Tax=Melittangium boletus DSM 14713 TaxID=1294270 RepID=A0A250IG86_9BACT|nr:hypothetical protein [Melittangium boletus]ATB30854.1 hypothetical protein MEBOL_004316 [Melittangium boletus DSM 14713]
MKLQVDIACCLTQTFDYDLSEEDARHLACLIAAGGAIETMGHQGAAYAVAAWVQAFMAGRASTASR